MDARLRREIEGFVREHIVVFHRWRAENLNEITLATLINNKNPYLFRAKNLNLAADLIAAVLAAQGHVTPSGKPYGASAIQSMLGSEFKSNALIRRAKRRPVEKAEGEEV